MKLISIVTIHLADFEGLAKTMRSIEQHLDSSALEWVLVDGGSKSATAEEQKILEEGLGKSSVYVSEPDQGIYDAMNKGTRMASGDYVIYLNAGDELHENFSLEHISGLTGVSAPGMIWGRCVERYLDGQEVELKTRSTAWTWYGMPAYHPAILFRRALLGPEPYNTHFQIAADYDLVSRLVKSGVTIQRIPMHISRFYHGGISDICHAETLREEHEIRTRHFPVPRLVSSLIKWLKTGLKTLSALAWFRRIWRRWV